MNDNIQSQIATLQASVDALAVMIAKIATQQQIDNFPPGSVTGPAREAILKDYKQEYAYAKMKTQQ